MFQKLSGVKKLNGWDGREEGSNNEVLRKFFVSQYRNPSVFLKVSVIGNLFFCIGVR